MERDKLAHLRFQDDGLGWDDIRGRDPETSGANEILKQVQDDGLGWDDIREDGEIGVEDDGVVYCKYFSFNLSS